jgi:hypothetical protein
MLAAPCDSCDVLAHHHALAVARVTFTGTDAVPIVDASYDGELAHQPDGDEADRLAGRQPYQRLQTVRRP